MHLYSTGCETILIGTCRRFENRDAIKRDASNTLPFMSHCRQFQQTVKSRTWTRSGS